MFGLLDIQLGSIESSSSSLSPTHERLELRLSSALEHDNQARAWLIKIPNFFTVIYRVRETGSVIGLQNMLVGSQRSSI